MGFGIWRFYEHAMLLNEEDGSFREDVTELRTYNCFAFIEEFAG